MRQTETYKHVVKGLSRIKTAALLMEKEAINSKKKTKRLSERLTADHKREIKSVHGSPDHSFETTNTIFWQANVNVIWTSWSYRYSIVYLSIVAGL